MTNTPRSGPAYILLGVEEQSGKVTGTPGVTDHPDEAELGRIISGKVDPVPRFTYRQVSCDGVEFGLIEIPRSQPVPVLPRSDYPAGKGVLRSGVTYFRRNTQNTEAGSEDINRIAQWGRGESSQDEPSSDSGTSSGGWEQIYRACDGFDPRRVYIAVLDRESSADTRDWTAMASVHWNVIVDFDTGTDTDGNHAVAKGPLGERQALRLSALDESPTITITARSTLWIAAAGLDSRPTTKPSANWRDWSRSKVSQLERTMNDLAGITEPAPVTLVVFGGGARYISTTCEIVDRAFTDRVEYVFANPNPELYRGIADDFGASSVTISLSDVCQGLREIQQDSGLPKETLFPRLEAGTVPMDPARARWLEEQLELVHLDVGSVTDDQAEEDSFLKGATISWNDLNGGVDADRDITSKLEQRIRRELNDRATRRVNLWYRPGAGATTGLPVASPGTYIVTSQLLWRLIFNLKKR